jgi:protein SCO1
MEFHVTIKINYLYMKLLIQIFFIGIMSYGFFSCHNQTQLPILGERDVSKKMVNGIETTDTIYHHIPDFEFINQYGKTVNQNDFKGHKIYVSDFFFTSCPTICPKMKTQMLRLFKQFEGDKSISFLSHTIDPRHDTVPVLKDYAQKLGIEGNQWQLVTGDKEVIYKIALKGYMATANEDSTAAGGFVHSGAFILVDKLLRVRGIYDGTVPAEVDQLAKDIKLLIDEK